MFSIHLRRHFKCSRILCRDVSRLSSKLASEIWFNFYPSIKSAFFGLQFSNCLTCMSIKIIWVEISEASEWCSAGISEKNQPSSGVECKVHHDMNGKPSGKLSRGKTIDYWQENCLNCTLNGIEHIPDGAFFSSLYRLPKFGFFEPSRFSSKKNSISIPRINFNVCC